MSVLLIVDIVSLAIGPFLLLGLITRVKALWAGRRGPPLLQPFYDVLRLVRKGGVISAVTTPVFGFGPIVLWVTTCAAVVFTPALSGRAPLSLSFDFVFVAYALGLGRIALMLSALDTGSAFEGMGASREATFSTLAEPVFFLVLGALAAASGQETLSGLLGAHMIGPQLMRIVAGLLLIACFTLLQVEAARLPVDDPTTHLELTMVHEVMVLDHSGLDLALVQHAAALKTFLWAELIVAVVVPLGPETWLGVLVRIASLTGVGVAIALVESTIARFKLRTVPSFIAAGFVAALLALVLSTTAVNL